MSKYKIRVEALDLAEELQAEYRMGIECDGFVIIADKGNVIGTSVHNMSMFDIATAMRQETDMLLSAAFVARAMAEADEYVRGGKANDAAKLLAGLFGKGRESEEDE